MASINIEQVCSPADIPSMVSVANITGVDLSAEEGFLLSRIDGHTSVSGVLQLSTFDAEKTLELLAALYSKGLINFKKQDGQTWDEFRASRASSGKANGSVSGAAETSKPAPDEELSIEDAIASEVDELELESVPDLTEEQCREIVQLHIRVTQATNAYEVLDVPRDAQQKTLKRKHREIAMKWHPDRYFRKDIGDYRDLIKTIFAMAHEAYEVLTDPDERKKLDNEIKLREYREQREEDKKKSEERSERVAARKKGSESIWARKLKEGLKGRIVKAKRHFQKGKEDFKAERYASASSNIQLAMTYDPWNEEYPEYWEEIKPTVNKAIHKEAMRRGGSHESMLEYKLAEAEFRRAVEANPDDPEANFRLGRVMLKRESDLRQAKDLLQKASMERPEDLEILAALGEAYEKVGMLKNALRTYENMKKLDRKNELANKKIKELKKKV